MGKKFNKRHPVNLALILVGYPNQILDAKGLMQYDSYKLDQLSIQLPHVFVSY